MMYWYSSGMSGWGYALMTISLILFWGVVIFGIVMLVRYAGRSGQPPAARSMRSSTGSDWRSCEARASPPTARLARPPKQARDDHHR